MNGTNMGFEAFMTQSDNMQRVLRSAEKFAKLEAPLLIEGETGTGKDLLASACVAQSPRGQQKFIAVNCAGLPNAEAESEMFGHGESENSVASQGFFEYANGGTVLLDSVTELPLELQAKLLRFINDGTFRRVGEDQTHYADVRVICTSQIPLWQAVQEGKLREDLYHRLNVLTLTIPPLRERICDIPQLADYFLGGIGQKLKRTFMPLDETVCRKLQNYAWRGNIRELYNVLYRACSLNETGTLTADDVQLSDEKFPFENEIDDLPEQGLEEMMNRFEEKLLRHFYRQYPTTRKLASRLGISHTAVANKLKQYGITKD
ncbi:sigma-54 factor interaction domain-containing protein [Actinobacillus delphinicola]|uniref:HTH-type transcriptional regulatory protein TyrR n=2 Tax=Actinobacillus delphinicola TaxID=51161 RepID=A0A448TUD2_9PAST|nr:sigma 54-interacting transcriptional regulator [Actinobacillus delphinicola]VEJ09451.1 sigma-54 factor interaction domain-containing protein [Actinobacillus delphinicola]